MTLDYAVYGDHTLRFLLFFLFENKHKLNKANLNQWVSVLNSLSLTEPETLILYYVLEVTLYYYMAKKQSKKPL